MDRFKQILTKYWGYSSFRPLQEEIIRAVVEGNDTLALMPTGGGKSITFQVPALYMDGICIVVTPLIALMRDQVDRLLKMGIKAAAVYSGMSEHEIKITLDNCLFGDYKFLYCSPERLSSELFRIKSEQMKVNLIAVDEAHCISQWGYDFRPSYLRIKELRKLHPYVPVLAVTATATSGVVNDIQEKLGFRKNNVLKKSFERLNLAYVVRESEDKQQELLNIVSKIQGTGIIYVRSRKKTKEIADFLINNKVSADFYHAGLSNEMRALKQNDWINNRTRVIVSTNAFGMGIDKANVRFVIHIDLPESLEEYFQEAGRAGRDEKKAYAVILYNKADLAVLKRKIPERFPETDEIRRVYEAVCNYLLIAVGSGKDQVYDFTIGDFCRNFNLNILHAYNSLKILQGEGLLELTDEVNNPSRVMFIVNRDDLYKFQVSNKQFDDFVKLVLRMYTGLFSGYCKVDEAAIAKRANTTYDTVYQYFKKLRMMKVIDYVPAKKTPLLVMTQERIELNSITFSKENYKNRKQVYEKRIDAVLSYVSTNTKCRSQQLLSYFDDNNPGRCGHCDICLKRNELNLSKYEFDLLLEDVKSKLEQKTWVLNDLVNATNYKKDDMIKVIQWLVDNNKIVHHNDNTLTWNKKENE